MPIPFITNSAVGLSLKSTKNANLWSRFIHRVMHRKANHIWTKIGRLIRGNRLLDVGMGSGSIAYLLKKKGFNVMSVDVASLSIYDDLKPVIYDGHNLPFKNKKFDTAVIIHVLHHCDDGLEVLDEAMRVSKRVVFIEDTFRNMPEKFLVSCIDSLTNAEFWWHKYRSVKEWKQIIGKRGWKIVESNEWSETGVTSPYGRYCLFAIERY